MHFKKILIKIKVLILKIRQLSEARFFSVSFWTRTVSGSYFGHMPPHVQMAATTTFRPCWYVNIRHCIYVQNEFKGLLSHLHKQTISL